jgi:hypothetical protein
MAIYPKFKLTPNNQFEHQNSLNLSMNHLKTPKPEGLSENPQYLL